MIVVPTTYPVLLTGTPFTAGAWNIDIWVVPGTSLHLKFTKKNVVARPRKIPLIQDPDRVRYQQNFNRKCT